MDDPLPPTDLLTHAISVASQMLNSGTVAMQAKTAQFKLQLQRGVSSEELLPEAFAVVREVSGRVLGMRHFDVQLV